VTGSAADVLIHEMTADSEDDIEGLKAIGHICAETLQKMMAAARAGMTTRELDDIGRRLLEQAGARSAPEVVYQYPGATCISVSPVIAHGIPDDHVLAEGELINIDISAEMNGYFGDTGGSMWIAKRTPGVHRLLEATRATLEKAVSAARAGQHLNEIGKTVQQEARKRGYNVIRELTGHGIGRGLHEEPREVWNFYNPRDHRILKEGLVLAIEPFLTTGHGHIVEEDDGWSLSTSDNMIAAQFEHTIIVTKGEPIILTV
jgi:methionyl aminopeptidase